MVKTSLRAVAGSLPAPDRAASSRRLSVACRGTRPVTEIIVELSESDGKTHMVMTHVGVPADSPGAMGWNMALDKLAAHVADEV